MTTQGQDPLIGKTLAEYEVQALIGRGAMGTVYLARDLGLDRNVALKVLLGSLADDPEVVRRFHLEAQTAARLRHPHIVQIYSAGVEGGTPYIAMEYIEGEPLDRFLRRQTRIPWQSALYIGQQVAEALDCAHGNGVIHRDVKPANILLDSHGRTRLTDFGIANVGVGFGESPPDAAVMGTIPYMSPEQCAGAEVGPRSDLYSLGVTLYYLISGRLPFEADLAEALINRITNDEAARLNRLLPEIPDDVARLVAHLMAKQPYERPANAQAVVMTILRLQAERGGRSAMPAALAAFMKEQTRIRPVRSLIKPTDLSDIEGPERASLPEISWRAWSLRAAAAAVFLLFLAAMTAGVSALSRRTETLSDAPEVPGVTFTDLGVDITIADLAAPGFRVEGIRWIGDASAALVHAVGLPGTMTHGAVGLMAVDPVRRRAVNVRSPWSPVRRPDLHELLPPTLGHPPAMGSAAGEPLDYAVVLAEYVPGERSAAFDVALVASPWNQPSSATLAARLPAHVWNPDADLPWWTASCGFAVPKPDGRTLCLVLNSGDGESNYLVERDLRYEDPTSLGDRLTTEGEPIVPQSVRYSPSGRQLCYQRLDANGVRELWAYASRRGQLNGNPVAWGVADDHVAFSPDETLLALRQLVRDGEPVLRIVSAANGMLEAELGAGEFGEEPWHPSGAFVVATHMGRLYAISLDDGHERVALTPADLRVRGGGSFSRDGRWIATVLDDPDGSGVAFIHIGWVTFGELTPRR